MSTPTAAIESSDRPSGDRPSDDRVEKSYQPMSAETHRKRGYCCGRGCYYCPWIPSPIERQPIECDDRIVAALRSGEVVTIESDRTSLVPSVVLNDRVTIVYKSYKPSSTKIDIICQI